MSRHNALTLATIMLVAMFAAPAALGQSGYPPFEKVVKGYSKVRSSVSDESSLWTIYHNKSSHELLAELPRNYSRQKLFIATSIAGGHSQTGYQWRDMYCYWAPHEKQLMLMEPNISHRVRGRSDAELKAAADRTFTDRVITSTKILTTGPGRGPVIDLDELLIKQMNTFAGMRGNTALAKIESVKAFPNNIEVSVTMPMARGRMTTIHYSISTMPSTSYKPRAADERVGYFMTVYRDLSKNRRGGDNFVRYVNRWNLQKRDSKLRLSPPVEPVIFYIEHTVPIRYRRFVREGILEWNKAFERCGIINAIEVRQQDAQSGAFMDLEPEDVRYNFFRWITSERAFAMGPSRVNPETGQILDADIIFDDAMLKVYVRRYRDMIEAYGLRGLDARTRAWLNENPLWDPIARFEPQHPLPELLGEADHARNDAHLDVVENSSLNDVVQRSHRCSYAQGKSLELQSALLAFDLQQPIGASSTTEGDVLDGVPEEFIGLIVREIVMHEVGHTLGLRHNFVASAWLTIDEYKETSDGANVGSVMDYNPIFIPLDEEEGDDIQWVTPTLGPYDYWAIEYGYTPDDKRRAELLKKAAENDVRYATDEDASGPDPYVNRYDLGTEPLEWSKYRMQYVEQLRRELMDKAVDDGQQWMLLRMAYEQLMGIHLESLRFAARYVGGVRISRLRKGDAESVEPITPVDFDKQRDALEFIVEHSFEDSAFDVRPELLRRMSANHFRHWGSPGPGNPAYSIHDRVAQLQAFTLMYLFNPSTLDRVWDNELRADADDNALTLPEIFNAVCDNVYRELDAELNGDGYDNRNPCISSLRRNLQSETLSRLIDLAGNVRRMPAPVRTLAMDKLRSIDRQLKQALRPSRKRQLDDYTRAHLQDMQTRVDRALDAVYTTTD